MAAIHDETRLRWEQYSPDQFIRVVVRGALREKIHTAYMVIHVYTQIIHHLPQTATMRLEVYDPDDESGEIGLRDLFMRMRDSIAALHDASEDDTPTLLKGHTAGDYIMQVVRLSRPHLIAIRESVQPVQADARIRQALLPELNSRRVGDITSEILRHTSDILQILDFAQSYAESITHQARSG
jgi:hypothetical protein